MRRFEQSGVEGAAAPAALGEEKAHANKVVRKAKAAETSLWHILDLALEAPRLQSGVDPDDSDAPRRAATLLLGLFAKGRLGSEHGDALDALGYLLHDAPNLRRLTASPKRNSAAYSTIPVELVDPAIVIRLLTETKGVGPGLEALALVAHGQDPGAMLARRGDFSISGRVLLDAARLRAGEALDDASRDAAIAMLVRGRVPLLLDGAGYVTVATSDAMEQACSSAPRAAFSAAYADYYAARGSGSRAVAALIASGRFDDDQLVRVVMSQENHVNQDDVLEAVLRLEVRYAPLFEALARFRAAQPWQFGHENDAARTLLACLGARAAARAGVPIPESFEAYVGPIENGLPWPTRRDGLAGVALFVLDTLRLLPSARAAALAESLLARSEERVALGRHAYYDSDAVLAAIASGDSALLARASVRLGTLPEGVKALAAAPW